MEEIIRLHDLYVDLTRQVARETGADLLDLAAEFARRDPSGLMQADGIHMNGAGLDLIADQLYDRIVQLAGTARTP